MDAFFASPELQICRSFHQACLGSGSVILHALPGSDPVREFAQAAASGLASPPRHLASRFLYDAQGSALFERITEQPEYYLTRTEESILAAHAPRIRELSGAVTLVELGSGNSAKTQHLLRAWLERAQSVCYVPVDVSESALTAACDSITSAYPKVRVVGAHCEYQEVFPLLPQLTPVLVLLLGSNIGNFTPAEMSRFLEAISAAMEPGDLFLVGVDLVKEPALMEAAYNDAAGVSASFTRNLFDRMNRELGCAIDTGAIEHVAFYDAQKEQIEIYARFTREQTLLLAPVGTEIKIGRGEMVRTEISRKFRLERFIPYLERFGFQTEESFTDERNWCALLLLRRHPRYHFPPRRS